MKEKIMKLQEPAAGMSASDIKAIDMEHHFFVEDKEKILYKNAEKYILSQPYNGSFVHFTPEKLDTKTQAVIDTIVKRPIFPGKTEELDAMVEKLGTLSYENFAAVYQEFSDEFNVESFTDENGWKTLKLAYKGQNNKNLPEANLIYIHGGGFMSNTSEHHHNFCECLARQMNFIVYIPLYPLAPNYYVQTTLDMLMELYKKVKAEGKPVYLMGDSAGGNIALSFGLCLKDRKEALPDALFGISPLCEFSVSNPLLPEYNKRDIFLPMPVIRKVSTLWKPKEMSYSDPRVSPMFGDWTDMPPIHLFAATDDSLYPDQIETAQIMRNAGVRVGMLIGRHLFHVAPIYPISVKERYLEDITEFLYGKR